MSAMEDIASATKRKASTDASDGGKKARTAELDCKQIEEFVHNKWQDSIVPALSSFIEIKNQSPDYDPEIMTNGLQEKAVDLIVDWVKKQEVEGISLEVIKDEGRTPLIFAEIPGTNNTDKTILLYGHFDKQPPMTEDWDDGLGPWSPVVRDGKLYGRGGADDGYSVFGAITAIKALQVQGAAHSRCVIIAEGCEESGSTDLQPYVDKLLPRIGEVSLVICLDSGCGNYNQLWMTTSLRGIAMGNLNVNIIKEGVHSGGGSGVIADSFRIGRQIMERIEDSKTGKILVPELSCEIPEQHVKFAEKTAETLGDDFQADLPFVGDAETVDPSVKECLLNRTWRPTLVVTGISGLPPCDKAGNVLRPGTTFKLSFRTPPAVDADAANAALEKVLTENPPYKAQVTYDHQMGMNGWAAPPIKPWLEKACNDASETYCKLPARYMGEGGTIPFMGMLGEKFPSTQFMITGVLGPKSNAHGPNEFIHIGMGEKVTMCVAHVINQHFKQ